MMLRPLPVHIGRGNRVVVFVLVEGIRSFASRSLIFLVLSKPIIATVDGINILLCSQIVVGIYGNVQTLGEEVFLGIFEGRHDDIAPPVPIAKHTYQSGASLDLRIV